MPTEPILTATLDVHILDARNFANTLWTSPSDELREVKGLKLNTNAQ